ncbi:hypothetical protein, partial [Mycobacterium marinum]|uniref:hypothetical protein n=1 Tax=Mycobacterium marinum TaxID=1781 RepID=UPI0035621AFD
MPGAPGGPVARAVLAAPGVRPQLGVLRVLAAPVVMVAPVVWVPKGLQVQVLSVVVLAVMAGPGDLVA